MAAITLPTTQQIVQGNILVDSGRRFFFGQVRLPSSYNTGGYNIAGIFPMTTIETLISGVFVSGGHTLCLTPNFANGVISGFSVQDITTGVEAISTFDCSGTNCYVLLVGN